MTTTFALPVITSTLPSPGKATLYAIAFDLVMDSLREHYSATSPQNAYAEVRTILEEESFAWTQGSVYFGDPKRVNAVSCVLAARRLSVELSWFHLCVRDIRMLRIEETNDLLPAINAP